MASLASAIRSLVLSAPDVTRLTSLRRSSSLFAQDQAAEAAYFVDDGLVKLTRTNRRGGRIILAIRGPEHLIGEEALAEGHTTYLGDAEVLTTAMVYRIPREVMLHAMANHPELGSAVIHYLLRRRQELAEKVELLCLHDVEYRILHYLADLAGLVRPLEDGHGYQLPITQLELADLIGATRETTSTTLNQLERRGFVRLSRRMLTIPSPSTLRDAAVEKAVPERAATGAV